MIKLKKENDGPEVELMIEQLKPYLELYEGCGNMLGIVPLTIAGFPMDFDFRTNPELRSFLAEWGKEIHSDSVMVLEGDPTKAAEQGYHVKMYVFEPSGSDGTDMAGGISTMCGNGVRAVAAYVRARVPGITEAKIMTMSGLRTIEWKDDLYAVDMGDMTIRPDDLAQYVSTEVVRPNADGVYFRSQIPEEILKDLAQFTSATTWSIGLNGSYDDEGRIDGEPHVIIEVPVEEVGGDINKLRKLAVLAGPIITKNTHLFPREVNVNFIVYQGIDKSVLEIMNCTHERNLGDDPDHSVTAACGTGSTVAGGVTMMARGQNGDESVVVHCTGGDMEISPSSSGGLIMNGPANKIS